MRKFLRDVYEVQKPMQFRMLGIFGFIVVSQAIDLLSPYLQKAVIDGLIKHMPADYLYFFATASLALWIFRSSILRLARDRYELAYTDFAIPERIQEFTLTKLFGLSIGQHTSENSGVKQGVVNRGTNALTNLTEIVFYRTIPLAVEIVVLTGILLYWSPTIGLIVLACVLAYIYAAIAINNHFREDIKKLDRMYVRDAKFQGEVVRNIPLIMAQAKEDRAIGECQKSLSDANLFSRTLWTRFCFLASIREAIPVVARFAVLAVGIRMVMTEQHTVGELVMLLMWTVSAVGNLGEISPLQRQFVKAHASAIRYFEMLNVESDVKILPNPVRPEKFLGRIEFKNVTFRYHARSGNDTEDQCDEDFVPEKKSVGPALNNVSFVIEAGQTVAFVGESGAGKSTLIHALVRAQDPEAGQIIVDGNDIRILDLKHFRESIGIVDQDVSLFDNTLRYNITYGTNKFSRVTDRELHVVAEMSCLDRFFHRLENGFDTFIGERGVKLSGGERQRVGIARALVKEPDILIFDEATSNLDSENEALIRDSIERVSSGRTTIIIAHRFSTIRRADKTIVLEKGRVVGEGTHDWLSKHCEAYQRLTQNQMV